MRLFTCGLALVIAAPLTVSPAVAATAHGSAAADSDHADQQQDKQKRTEDKNLKLGKYETAIFVTNMHCKTCARKISGKLFALKGVKEVRSDVKANLSIVINEPKAPLDPFKAWAAVQAAGFIPTKLIGPAGTYVPHKDKDVKKPVKVAEKSKESKDKEDATVR